MCLFVEFYLYQVSNFQGHSVAYSFSEVLAIIMSHKLYYIRNIFDSRTGNEHVSICLNALS